MLNRWIGIGALLVMLAANTSLFIGDILPRWTAGNPPVFENQVQDGLRCEFIQTGIFDDQDLNVGRCWTEIQTQSGFVSVTSRTLLHPINLPDGLSTPAVRVDSDLRYEGRDHLLNELTVTVYGLPITAMLHGELIPPDQFACRWHAGKRRGTFVLDAGMTRAFGDVLRPFVRLPGLYVGQSWRLQLMNPLSRALPGLNSEGLIEEPEVARVTRTEVIQHCGQGVEAFVVEAPRLRAWVRADGTVLRQEIELLPLLGRLVLRDEPFDEAAYKRAAAWRAEQ